jgi:DNA-binding MarR family transcriptional regulator
MNRDQHAAHAWQAMRTLMFDLNDSRNEVSDTLGMSFFRAKALMKLADGPLTMRELVAKLASDAPYTSVVVDDLERRGLVERSVHPGDRRVKVVSLTAAGRESAVIATEIQNRPPAVLNALSANDLAILDRILTALTTEP